MCSQLGLESLKITGKLLTGWLPVRKPSGICCSKIQEGLRLDIYHYYGSIGLNVGQVLVAPYQALEHFADGLVTYRIGNSDGESVPFKMSDSIYEATIEFGADRQFHSIDGELIGFAPTDHLKLSMIRAALSGFLGYINQERCPHYRVNLQGCTDRQTIPNSSTAKEYYDLMSMPHLTKDPSKRIIKQKYPFVKPKRTLRVDEIIILDHRDPFLKLRINTVVGFSVRQFAVDLADKLQTKASVVELTRIKEGPIELGDLRVVPLRDLSIDCYGNQMKNLRSLYRNFLREMQPLVEEFVH